MSRTRIAAAAIAFTLLIAAPPVAAQAPGSWTPLPETVERERALRKQLEELEPRVNAATVEGPLTDAAGVVVAYEVDREATTPAPDVEHGLPGEVDALERAR